METNSQQLFLDNLRLKQLIQRKQLIKQLQNPGYSKYHVPPLGTYMPTAPVMRNYQQNYFPFTAFNIPLLDNHYNSYPTNPSPFPALDNFPSTYPMPTYPLPSKPLSTTPSLFQNLPRKPIEMPKQFQGSYEDVEFKRTTGLDPNNLTFSDIQNMKFLNARSGQIFPEYQQDIKPIYDSLGTYPTKFKLTPSLKRSVSFLEHEKQGFSKFNRLW